MTSNLDLINDRDRLFVNSNSMSLILPPLTPYITAYSVSRGYLYQRTVDGYIRLPKVITSAELVMFILSPGGRKRLEELPEKLNVSSFDLIKQSHDNKIWLHPEVALSVFSYFECVKHNEVEVHKSISKEITKIHENWLRLYGLDLKSIAYSKYQMIEDIYSFFQGVENHREFDPYALRIISIYIEDHDPKNNADFLIVVEYISTLTPYSLEQIISETESYLDFHIEKTWRFVFKNLQVSWF